MRAVSIPLPERKRSYRFALTPLADAMFQLLIFFMLSTSLTPYSLITLRTETGGAEEASDGGGPGPEQTQPAAPTGPSDVTIWTVGNGTVTTQRQPYDLDQLTQLATDLGSSGATAQVVLVVTAEARIQDVAAAMEALSAAQIEGVQITTLGGG